MLPKLHRRVFLDKIQRDQLTVYISFYIEAANRDAFMATKQEIFMQFATACARHGAKLAQNRHQVHAPLPGPPPTYHHLILCTLACLCTLAHALCVHAAMLPALPCPAQPKGSGRAIRQWTARV